MQRLLTLGTVAALLTACGPSGPSDSEIKTALADSLSNKGCATTVLFKKFPLTQADVGGNERIVTPFVNAGLVAADNGSYRLTEQGQAAYDAKKSGFCYTDSYTLSDIEVLSKESADDLPPALSGAWLVKFKITPANVADWVKQPGVVETASRASLADITEPKTYTVRLAKKKGEDTLIVADPRFSFSPGIHYNMSW